MYLKFLFGLYAINFVYSIEFDPDIYKYFTDHIQSELNISATRVPKRKQIRNNCRSDFLYLISGGDEKVDVRLYYECLCPYSIRFYTEEFNNTVAELAAYIEVKTYPYGNARMIEENGKTHVKCQHDEPECYGNKLHACAIDAIKDTTRYVSYISCMMSGNWGGYGSTDKAATKCGKLTEIDAKPIIECAKGEKGEKLLEHYGKETEKDVPNRLGVPWTLVNGKYTSDLKSTICAALKKPPSQCKA